MKRLLYICAFLTAFCASSQITVTHSVYFDVDKDQSLLVKENNSRHSLMILFINHSYRKNIRVL